MTEPILYRHFESKRHLYLACLEESWTRTRALWEAAIEAEPDPALWVAAMGRSFLESPEHRPLASSLWVQALAEATEDREVERYLRKHMRDVHRFVADVIRRAQDEKSLPAERDPEAEAWIFIALGLLSMAERCVGGLTEDAWPAIRASRVAWLTGRPS